MSEKILTCTPMPPPHGGITNWYQILMREADRNGVEFVNVDTSPKTPGNKRSLFNRIVVQGFGMLRKYRQLKQVVVSHPNIDCAHLVTSAQFGLVRDIVFMRFLKKKGIPAVYHLHFGRVPEILSCHNMECRLLKIAVSLADTIIAIDRHTQDVMQECFCGKTIKYIPNPVDLVVGEENEAVTTKTIVYLGMVYKEKGIEELLQAWTLLEQQYPQWELTIAGACDENYENYLKSHFPCERVTYTGFLPHDEAMNTLDKSSFLVLPSYTEGFPNVVIEAMMHKKAVIGTCVGAIEDILSGGCGVVIPPKDVQRLKSAIERLMQDPVACDDMGRCGFNKVRSQYATDVVFAQYLRVWKNISKK